jgi:hypothetical protein
MKRKRAMTDMFGNGQHSLFGDGKDRIPHQSQQSSTPDPERVRQKLHALLETARSADRMPWDPRKAGMWQIVFPQMANWLPDDEAAQLRFEFTQELERLRLAA